MILKNMEKIKNSNFVSPQNAPEPEEDMTSVCSCDCTSCNPFYSRYVCTSCSCPCSCDCTSCNPFYSMYAQKLDNDVGWSKSLKSNLPSKVYQTLSHSPLSSTTITCRHSQGIDRVGSINGYIRSTILVWSSSSPVKMRGNISSKQSEL